MTFVQSVTTRKNIFQGFSILSLIPVLLIMSILLLSTAALAISSTSTTLAVSPASATAGSVITLTATVASEGVPLTAGQVAFCNASAPYCDDSALLGTVWVTTSGTATLRRTLPSGTTNVKAVFQATKSYSTSSSSAQAVVVIGAQIPVTTANTFPILGSSAVAFATGDFNNDGISDLAIADQTGNIQIFLGCGDGTFTTGVSINPLYEGEGVGIMPSLATGDFNRDGNLDIVYNGHHILLGNGDGTFTVSPTPILNIYGTNAQVADFNHDGIADIVVFTGDSDFQVLLGNGDGTFTNGPITGSTGGGVSFAIGDFNGDGIPDIAVSGGFGLGVQIMIGQGDGSFLDDSYVGSNEHSYLNGLGLDADGVAVGDFNGDGKADIAVSDFMNHTVTILTGNGDGTFTVGTPISTGMPAGSTAYQRQVVAGDFNGDGKTDVAVVIAGNPASDPTLSILLGNGDGTFGPANTFTATPAESFCDQAVAVGDFFGTGRSAIALLTGVSPSYVTILQDVSGLTPVKNMPTITWATPAAINYGSALSSMQLNATAGVPGAFTYTPAAGTVVEAGRQTLSVMFTPTDTADYSEAEAMITLTVNPVSYSLLVNPQSVDGSAKVTLSLTSTDYAGTVSFAVAVTSPNGTSSNVSASAPSVTLTSGGNGSSVLTIAANANAANHAPVAPWTGGGAVVFGAVMLGAPFAVRRRKKTLAVLLTTAAITLAGFSMACGGVTAITHGTTVQARTYLVTVTPTGTGTVANPSPVTIAVTVL